MSMPNKDRQKRSVRKARAAERRELEEKHAISSGHGSKKATPAPVKAQAKKSEPKKVGFFGRIKNWFKDVKTEMGRVTWPSKSELKNYSVAVIAMLVVFGVAVWLVDTGVVAALIGFTGLRG